jgi:succinylglutamic semialdehyde dehydrogenase
MSIVEGTLLIGAGRPAGRGAAMESSCPWDGRALWQGAAASTEQIDQAVAAARAAFTPWQDVDRVAMASAFVARLKNCAGTMAEIMALETGRPLWETTTEVSSMVSKLSHSITAQKARCTETQLDTGGASAVTRFKPHGVAAVFGPFNMPGHLPNGHIIPALLAGNTIVFKPSEKAPHTGEFMCGLWREAGLPAGVLNLVQGGREVGEALASHAGLDAIFFTGSVAAGQALMRLQQQFPQRLLALEMGGNNPLVVFDCDNHHAAAYTALVSAFLTSGQRCTCARRFIVGPGDMPVLIALAAMTKTLRVGGPLDTPEPFMGPLISIQAATALLAAQDRLIAAGGNVIVRAGTIPGHPAAVTPGIVDVTEIPDRTDEEIFGPLLQVVRVNDFHSAIKEANHTRYGLSAALLSGRRELFDEFHRTVRAGVINFNRPTNGASSALPFGGIGISGNHRPSGAWAVDYCSYPVASMETSKLTMPEKAAPGIVLPEPLPETAREPVREPTPNRSQESVLVPLPARSPAGIKALAVQHVTLWVSDVQRARAFYSGILGLTEVPRPSWFDFKGTWYAVGQQQIHITHADPLPPRTREHFCLQVADLSAARDYLESCGVPCSADRDYTGTRRFIIFDPDDHYIEISQIDTPWPLTWPERMGPEMRGPLT